MKKYLVIGNPIEHSLSPKLHNFWIEKNGINAIYEKKKIDNDKLVDLILEVKKKNIHGINVTVPFKQNIISYLDHLSLESEKTQSVNTVYMENNKIIGHNTDIVGFEQSIKSSEFNMIDKKVFILGAGGVVPSIIFALNKLGINEIIISNRTKSKAQKIKDLFKKIKIVEWGEVPKFDIIINATSIGLKKNDEFNLDISKVGKNKFFYDVIYNPKETNFLKKGKELGNKTENGKNMFIHQASAAFKIWHNVQPEISNNVEKLLD